MSQEQENTPQGNDNQEPNISQEQVNHAVEKCLNEGKCGPFNDIMSQLSDVQKALYNIPQTLQGTVTNDVENILDDIAGRLKNIENKSDVSDLKDEILSRTYQFAQSQTDQDQPSEQGAGDQNGNQPQQEEDSPDETQLLQKVISGLTNLETMLESSLKEDDSGEGTGKAENNNQDRSDTGDNNQSQKRESGGLVSFDPRPDVFGG